MTILNAGMDLAGQQIDPGQQAQRAVSLVLMITGERGVRSRLRRQVRRGVADRLNARLLVIGNDGDVLRFGFAFPQDRDLTIDAEHLGHLRIKLRVASFEIIANLVWLYVVMIKDFADRALSDTGEAGMPGRRRVLTDMGASSRVVQSSCR